jgi:hypothetical protein
MELVVERVGHVLPVNVSPAPDVGSFRYSLYGVEMYLLISQGVRLCV